MEWRGAETWCVLRTKWGNGVERETEHEVGGGGGLTPPE